jgi:hypothetical protein
MSDLSCFKLSFIINTFGCHGKFPYPAILAPTVAWCFLIHSPTSRALSHNRRIPIGLRALANAPSLTFLRSDFFPARSFPRISSRVLRLAGNHSDDSPLVMWLIT